MPKVKMIEIPKDKIEAFKSKLDNELRNRNLTRKKLAEILEVDYVHLNKQINAGKVSWITLDRIGAYLDVAPEYLAGMTEDGVADGVRFNYSFHEMQSVSVDPDSGENVAPNDVMSFRGKRIISPEERYTIAIDYIVDHCTDMNSSDLSKQEKGELFERLDWIAKAYTIELMQRREKNKNDDRTMISNEKNGGEEK